jgi:hypothetical protein
VIQTISDKVSFIESVFGAGKLARNSKNFDVKCPVCAPKDGKRKLAIRVEDDACHCWVCGFRAKSLAPLIRKYSSHDRLIQYRDQFMKGRLFITDDLNLKSLVPELPNNFRLLATATNFDPDVRALKKYITSRGLDEHDLWYYKFGYSEEYRWSRRVIMPSFNASGKLNYFVGRAIDKHRKPKYDNPDFDKLPIIFNEINIDWSQRLVICEGPFDLVKCGENAVPLLGSDLNEQSELFNSILVNSTPVALALDPDMRVKKIPKIAKKLAMYDIDVTIVDVRPFEDAGSMTKKEFKEALDLAKPFSWFDSFQARLDNASGTSLAM